jgi:hypothetical protein
MNFRRLYEPIGIGLKTTRNRVMRLATVTNLSAGRKMRAAGIADVRVVGDAFAPRRLANAIEDGHRAGRAV